MARKRRRQNRKPKQRRAGKPKPGRSLWAFKPRTVSRQAHLRASRKKFVMLPFSKGFWEGQAIARKGVENLSEAEKRSFLARHKAIAAKAASGGKITASKARQVIAQAKAFSEIKGKTLNTWVVETQNAITKAETADLGRKIDIHLKKYFKARKIPVRTVSERAAFNLTIEQLVANKMSSLVSPLDLAWIEQSYLEHRRGFKSVEQEEGVDINAFFRETFGRERLTANQRKTAKKWFQKNWHRFQEEKLATMKKFVSFEPSGIKFGSFEKAFEASLEIEQRFKERARTELLKIFREREKVFQQQKPAATPREKIGSRPQRMAAYVKREKTRTEKKTELRKEEQRAKIAGKPFDSISYALKEIALENRQSAAFLKTLVNKGLLKKYSLISLFTSGSLTQKVFQKAASDPEFKNRFGSNNIDRLARGLAYIGSKGRQTAGAKRAFQGQKGKKLFEFLAKKKYIDTKHGKGMVITYLARI